VEILEAEAGSRLDEMSRQHLHTIARSATHLGQLIDALLAFSRMGRGEMFRQKVSLASLVAEARRELHRDIEGRSIEWHISMLPEVQGDPLMLRQVIINLLSNALKYTRTRKCAEIDITAKNTDREVIFSIRDNGVGFDPKYADKLFGVFQRLHPISEFEGIGIGLANVRRIIHRHGGRTWAEGTVDGGATFYFSLPRLRKG
jgi:signal transduction histidine kinase